MARRFTIYPEPHVADPAWLRPVVEIDGEELRGYSNPDQLQKVVSDLWFALGRAEGRAAEEARTHKFLEAIGWSPEGIRTWMFYKEK